MDLKNIKVGDKFTTFNGLVKALDLQPAKGTQRISQQKEIECYLSFERTGKISRGKITNEIIITEIYDTPIEKLDGRKKNIKLIEQYLMYYINNNNSIKQSKVSIYHDLECFIDNDFFKKHDYLTNSDLTEKQISGLKNIIFDVCGQTVYNRLLSLKNKNYIYMEDAYDCSNGLFLNGSDEYEKIKREENNAIQYFGFSTFAEAVNSKKKKEFLKLRSHYIRTIRNADGSRGNFTKCKHIMVIDKNKNKEYDMTDFDYEKTKKWFVKSIRNKYIQRIKSYSETHNKKIDYNFVVDKENQIAEGKKQIPEFGYLFTEQDVIDFYIGEDEERNEYIKNCYYSGFGYISKKSLASLIDLINEITGGNINE